MTRSEARSLILAEALKVRQQSNMRLLAAAQRTGKPLQLNRPIQARHLQRAVCVVRRQRLVSAEVLEAAGFRS